MNNCDLEETKHLAFEKFKELTADPKFKAVLYDDLICNRKVVVGPFEMHSYRDPYLGKITLSLSDVEIGAYMERPFVWTRKEGTKAYKAARDKHRAEVAKEREDDPIAKAFDSAVRRVAERKRQEQCERMVKAMEEDCNKLQAALAKPINSPDSNMYESPEAGDNAPWWKFWA